MMLREAFWPYLVNIQISEENTHIIQTPHKSQRDMVPILVHKQVLFTCKMLRCDGHCAVIEISSQNLPILIGTVTWVGFLAYTINEVQLK